MSRLTVFLDWKLAIYIARTRGAIPFRNVLSKLENPLLDSDLNF